MYLINEQEKVLNLRESKSCIKWYSDFDLV